MSETAVSAPVKPSFSTQPPSLASAELALVQGDLSRLSEEQRLQHYINVCNSLGLNYLTQPLEYFSMKGGKLKLYPKAEAAAQLRDIHGISFVGDPVQAIVGDILTVTIKTEDRKGRKDADIGAVSIKGLSGEDLANAFMKAVTKAKRRVTMSACGLGWMDEDFNNRPTVEVSQSQQEQLPPGPPLFDQVRDSLLACRTKEDMSEFVNAYLKVKNQLSAPEQSEIAKAKGLWKPVEVAQLPAAEVKVEEAAKEVQPDTIKTGEPLIEDLIITETRITNAINNSETPEQYTAARDEFKKYRDSLPMDARSRIINTAAKHKAALEKKLGVSIA